MAKSRDEIKTFIPDQEPELIILGTMGSINARTINGVKPKDFFFYNNIRNHFWRVLQHLFEPDQAPKILTVPEKKAFLNRHRIAMANIVDEMEVTHSESLDPSDDILFKAHRKGKLSTKKESAAFRKLLETKPTFFTCRNKKSLGLLLTDYYENNKIKNFDQSRIWFWATPTRCNPLARSLLWKKEMVAHLKNKF